MVKFYRKKRRYTYIGRYKKTGHTIWKDDLGNKYWKSKTPNKIGFHRIRKKNRTITNEQIL